MRRVAAGEASQTDGILHKGLPLRVLNNRNNNLILKDDGGYDTDDNMYGRPMNFYNTEGDEGDEGEESEGEGTLSEERLDTIWDELHGAMADLRNDPRYGHIGEKLGDLLENFTAAMHQEQQGGE